MRYATDMLMTKMQTLVLVSQLIGSQKYGDLEVEIPLTPRKRKKRKRDRKQLAEYEGYPPRTGCWQLYWSSQVAVLVTTRPEKDSKEQFAVPIF